MDPDSIFINSTLTCNVTLPMSCIGGNIASILGAIIADTYECKCCENGYVKKGTCKVLTYSAGEMDGTTMSGDIHFTVTFSAMIFTPVVGTIISGKIENIVKIGLSIVSNTYTPSPFIAFITRDHNPTKLSKYKEGDTIMFKVRGSTFNLHDKTIYIIADIS